MFELTRDFRVDQKCGVAGYNVPSTDCIVHSVANLLPVASPTTKHKPIAATTSLPDCAEAYLA